MKTMLSVTRLNDSHAREGREDGKRVYELRMGRQHAVLNFYTHRSERTEKLWENNVRILRLMERRDIPAARILSASPENLIFVTTHVGEQLDQVLKKISAKQGMNAIGSAAKIILSLAAINAKPKPFSAPRPMERFQEAWREGTFRKSTRDARKRVREALTAMEQTAAALQQKRFRYGFGRIDGDLINFARDNQGRIATFDFDGLREYYDPYYVLGYMWVSIERVNQPRPQHKKVAALRAALEYTIAWDEPHSRERFALGATAAMSIALFHRPKDAAMIRHRTKAILEILKPLT